MKPERINVAPWINQWDSAVPFIHKRFTCESFIDAAHTASHVHRVVIGYTESEVKTSTDDDNVVTVKILPRHSESLTDAQFALGQRIDEALSYLMEEADFTDDLDVEPDISN